MSWPENSIILKMKRMNNVIYDCKLLVIMIIFVVLTKVMMIENRDLDLTGNEIMHEGRMIVTRSRTLTATLVLHIGIRVRARVRVRA